MADRIARSGPLEGKGPIEVTGKVTVRVPSPEARFLLRGHGPVIERAGAAFGVPVPLAACRAEVRGARAALWLGPDEWLLLAPEAEGGEAARALAAALAGTPHALADIGHRQAGIEVAGPLAPDLLNAGCPLDLDPEAFPVAMCTRTLLGKVEVVLWRREPDRFRLDVQRSLADYAWRFLAEAAREHGAG